MTGAAARRGQPLAALVMVLGGWIAMRVMMWDAAALESPRTEEPAARTMFATIPPARAHAAGAGPARVQTDGADAARPTVSFEPQRPIAMPSGWAEPRPIDPPLPALAPPAPPLLPVSSQPARADGRVAMAAGHQLLWMAAVSQLPLPAGLLAAVQSQQSGAAPQPVPYNGPVDLRRWSMDGWLMLRRDGTASLAAGGLPASYGASQAGAVLRYRLAPGSANRPTAYLRVTGALNGSREQAAAVGLSARPLRRVPVVAAVELRLVNQPGGTRLRPAAMVVSEFPPVPLPAGLRGEAYVQAGYVGGRDATAFADGQLRIDRRIARAGSFELRAGGGAWAGAQRGASRVDVGPTASLGTQVGGGSLRVGVDWRVRVAGNAAPGSGAAVTLSAGF